MPMAVSVVRADRGWCRVAVAVADCYLKRPQCATALAVLRATTMQQQKRKKEGDKERRRERDCCIITISVASDGTAGRVCVRGCLPHNVFVEMITVELYKDGIDLIWLHHYTLLFLHYLITRRVEETQVSNCNLMFIYWFGINNTSTTVRWHMAGGAAW